VLSVNCSSGAYDYDETSFAGEALVKANGGAVGVFGDTRDSPSTANTQMSLGFVDALLPSVLPGEGPATKQRMGNALNWGKMRLNAIAPLPNGTTRSEFYLWHYYGDPSMQMWGGGNAPIVFNPALVTAVYKPGPISIPDPPPYEVEVNLGQVLGNLTGQPISLLQNGQVIGKAFLNATGAASIPASFGDGSVKPGELEVAFEGDGAQPFKVPVAGVPPAPTTLTQNCPSAVTFSTQTSTAVTVSGTLAGAPAGSAVAVTFTRPVRQIGNNAPAAVVTTINATTDAAGAWTATVTTSDRADLGTWSVSSSYAGTAQYAAASGGPCTFLVALETPT
jgi:hypothetical protein